MFSVNLVMYVAFHNTVVGTGAQVVKFCYD
jgi:hypothetical protein